MWSSEPQGPRLHYSEVRRQAETALTVPPATKVDEHRWLDMRYLGQNHELRIPVGGDTLDDGDVARLTARFHETHRTRHGYDAPEAPVQIVNVRVALRVPPAPLPEMAVTATARPEPFETRDVFFAETDGAVRSPVYRRGDLPAGFELRGPAILEQMDSTVVVPPDVAGVVHASGSLLLELR